MTMDRRYALKQIGAAGAIAAFAGCVSVSQQSSGESSNNGDSDGNSTSGSVDQEAKSSKPAGKATTWHAIAPDELPLRKELISSFNEQSRHTIIGERITNLEKKTTTAIPAGQGPAMFEWAHDWVGDYYQRGFIVDQSEKLSVSLDTFTSAAAGAVQFDGATVGLPHGSETVALIHNTDIVDEAPSSVAEMVSIMKEYHNPKEGQYGLSYPFDPYFTSAWLQAFGGYYFDAGKDPMLGVNLPETIKGLQFALDNFRPYMPNDPKYETQAAAFTSGNAAFAINGPWYLATLDKKGINYEVTPFPTLEGGEPNPYTGITMRYFAKGMQEDEATAAATRAYVQWAATNEDHLLKAARKHGTIPVLKSLVGNDKLPPTVRAYSEAVNQGITMPSHPKMNAVFAAMGPALIAAFTDAKSPKKALNDAAKSIRSNWN